MKRSLIKLILIVSVVLNACADAGYVTTEPTYIEMGRPRQPSAMHIWISGDWIWQRESNRYMRNQGYWELPRRGKLYSPGYWESRPKGKHWVTGKWHK
jgi:hypothetical protein